MTTREQRSIFVKNMIDELARIENDLQTNYLYADFSFQSYAEKMLDMYFQKMNICIDYFITLDEANNMNVLCVICMMKLKIGIFMMI